MGNVFESQIRDFALFSRLHNSTCTAIDTTSSIQEEATLYSGCRCSEGKKRLKPEVLLLRCYGNFEPGESTQTHLLITCHKDQKFKFEYYLHYMLI